DRRIGYDALFTTPAEAGDGQVPGQLSIDDLDGDNEVSA
ncbi:MAG: hypothetical protein QG655_3294, partial [Actinomycetota bacterium]|nr:hypothetical protein [Actinomycetota bacterium]